MTSKRCGKILVRRIEYPDEIVFRIEVDGKLLGGFTELCMLRQIFSSSLEDIEQAIIYCREGGAEPDQEPDPHACLVCGAVFPTANGIPTHWINGDRWCPGSPDRKSELAKVAADNAEKIRRLRLTH